MNEHRVDILIIGAGQAGLSIAYHLRQQQKKFIVIDRGNEIGEVWRKRYDSLVLFTPQWYSSLPGLPLEGNPESYATKDKIADYLQNYVRTFEITVHLRTEVFHLEKTSMGFKCETNQGIYLANKVVIAVGPFQKPFIPKLAASLPDHIYQVHSSNYHNPKQLKDGNVLVVGAGNSGAQIAVELSENRDVSLSIGHKIKFMPLELMGKSIFGWFQKLGILNATIMSLFGRWLSRKPDPIFGKELKALIYQGVIQIKPRVVKIMDDRILFEDQSQIQTNNIIWATGFYSEYNWIRIPGTLSENAKPVHQRGVSPVNGLFFLGLPWQYRRGSALIGGVGEDAKYLIDHLS